MQKPSSTIQAAVLAGSASTFGWELIGQFTNIEPKATLVGASAVVASGLVGYWKKENVLPVKS